MLKTYRKVPRLTGCVKLGEPSTAPFNPRMAANSAFVRSCSFSATLAASLSATSICTVTARTAPFVKFASSGVKRIVKSDGERSRKAASPSPGPGSAVPFTYRSGL